MAFKQYQIISEFDESKDYGFSIRPRHKKCLSLFEQNQTITPSKFVTENHEKIGKKETPLKQKKDIFYQAISIGKNVGLVKDYVEYPISFRDFTSLESVHYFTEQLRRDKRKNTQFDNHNLSPTQKSYFYALWNFSNLFYGKEFESNTLVQTALNEYKKIKSKTILEGLEHFFYSLYRVSWFRI